MPARVAWVAAIDKYRGMLGELTDPRATPERRARPSRGKADLLRGMRSTKTGGPEMLTELACRLIVEETPFIQNIRNNVITPVIEVDGREKQVDTYYRAGRSLRWATLGVSVV